MTKTGTQNRPYDDVTRLIVDVTFTAGNGRQTGHRFDWNNRQAVREFAADADRVIREGGKVETRQAAKYVQDEANRTPTRAPETP